MNSNCCESHFSLLLNRFVQTHPLTTAINNQMNSVLFMLQSIVYKIHSLSSDLNRKFYSAFNKWNLKTCSCVEGQCLSIANVQKDSTNHVCLGL